MEGDKQPGAGPGMGPAPAFPRYAQIISLGGICRQDAPGGEWEPLDAQACAALLDRLAGVKLEQDHKRR